MKLVVVPVNPNTPVALLYERYDPVVESDVREILELKDIQSETERAPEVVALARARESCCPERERPFEVPSVTAS